MVTADDVSIRASERLDEEAGKKNKCIYIYMTDFEVETIVLWEYSFSTILAFVVLSVMWVLTDEVSE